jgi:hypothetical protein
MVKIYTVYVEERRGEELITSRASSSMPTWPSFWRPLPLVRLETTYPGMRMVTRTWDPSSALRVS